MATDKSFTVGIAIPVVNGAPFLESAISSVLDQTEFPIELIVSVDQSCDESFEVASLFHDDRLRITSPPNALSMAGHYEWCLRQLSTDWVTILGQDDGLMPHFGSVVADLLPAFPEHNAFSFQRAYYFWPGTESMYGKWQVKADIASGATVNSSLRTLNKVISGTAAHFDLPQIYTNNLIHRSVIDRLRQEYGDQWILEPTPDVFSGFAIATSLEQFVRVRSPVFWTGTSTRSSGHVISTKLDYYTPNSVPPHISRALREGRAVAPEVGIELWLSSDSSQIFALSAVSVLSRKKPLNLDLEAFSVRGLGAAMLGTFPPFSPKGHSRKLRHDIRRQIISRSQRAGISAGTLMVSSARSLASRSCARGRWAWNRLSSLFYARRLPAPKTPINSIKQLNIEWIQAVEYDYPEQIPQRRCIARWRHLPR